MKRKDKGTAGVAIATPRKLVLRNEESERGESSSPTPAKDDVPPQVSPLGEQGDTDQAVQVVALSQEPAVVGHDAVVGECCCKFTTHLQGAAEDKEAGKQVIPGLISVHVIWDVSKEWVYNF